MDKLNLSSSTYMYLLTCTCTPSSVTEDITCTMTIQHSAKYPDRPTAFKKEEVKGQKSNCNFSYICRFDINTC